LRKFQLKEVDVMRLATIPLVFIALLLGSAIAFAQATSDWDAGPGATGSYFCSGAIDSPAPGSVVSSGTPVQVSGWIVDMTASGWAGFDDLHVYDGYAGSGQFLAKGTVGLDRPDVATAMGNADSALSGFAATIPAGALGPGQHTLTVYAHTPDKGWWYRQVPITVEAQPSTNPVVAGITIPEYGDKIYTGDATYTLRGYALDQRASVMQGSQGSGIDRVQIYINDAYAGDADLGFSDSSAAAFGQQFANAGFRFTFKPTSLHDGNVQLEVRAHSVVTGSEISVPTTFLIVEGKRPSD
jgi:hypothetical protein